MTEKRQQSPHYIPELDPANKNRPTDLGERALLWLQYLQIAAFFVSAILAVSAWLLEWSNAGQMTLIAVVLGFVVAISFAG